MAGPEDAVWAVGGVEEGQVVLLWPFFLQFEQRRGDFVLVCVGTPSAAAWAEADAALGGYAGDAGDGHVRTLCPETPQREQTMLGAWLRARWLRVFGLADSSSRPRVFLVPGTVCSAVAGEGAQPALAPHAHPRLARIHQLWYSVRFLQGAQATFK